MKEVLQNQLIPGRKYIYIDDDDQDVLKFIKSNRIYSIFELIIGNISNYTVSRDGFIRFPKQWGFSWYEIPFKFGRK